MLLRAAVSCATAALLGTALSLTPAKADQFKIKPSISATARVDDNPLLRISGAKTAFIGTLSPQLQMSDKNNRLALALDLGADLRGYSGLSNRSPDSERGELNVTYLLTERTQVGLNASARRTTLLDQLVDNTGHLTQPVRITTASATPNVSFRLSPVDQLNVDGFVTTTNYDTAQLVDYRQYGGSIGWRHALSEVSSISFNATAERIEAVQSFGSATEVFAAEVAFSRQLTDKLSFQLSAGPEYSRLQEPAPFPSRDNVGYRAKISLTGQLSPVETIAASAEHKSQPTSYGGVAERTSLNLHGDRKLGPRLSLTASANFVLSQPNVSALDNLRNYIDVRLGPDWKIGRFSSLSLAYAYRREEFRIPRGHASSNGVYLTIQRSFWNAPS